VIVGGGPAGSACAWKLRNAGLDVAIVDKAAFPRDKVCAGWITPQIVDDLKLDLDQYRAGRTFQPITGFRVGVIGQARTTEIRYARPVSYGIRRCEFDHYLLQRSGARLLLGAPVSSIRRDRGGWVVGGSIRASMLVGAGGHFCPVGRLLNGPPDRAVVVAARETEFRIDPRDAEAFAIGAESAELYFCRDLGGYGWCFRKQDFLNIGFGRVDARALPKETDQFAAFLAAMRRVPPSVAWQWHGHAYMLGGSSRRRLVDDGVVLVGDSAGLAYPESGEGIRPAIESGLLAASAIIDSDGHYERERLGPYAGRLRQRLGVASLGRSASSLVPRAASRAVARRLLGSPWFVRHVMLDRWFLHSGEPALA